MVAVSAAASPFLFGFDFARRFVACLATCLVAIFGLPGFAKSG